MGGHLDRLELHNFKSYGGDVVVGPFRPGFNCICGTNGSGKSNVMDAISFVLGVRTSQLRGNQLRDLVYRNTEDPNDDPSGRRAHVRLIYVTDAGAQLVFHRGINSAGSSDYKVNSRSLSLEKYNEKLAEIGVLVKARNFLVFQNEVEGIASKSPKDLTAMFEEVSGSAELRDRYDTARVAKETAEENVMGFWRKRKGMAAERRQYKEQKEEAEKFRRLQEQLAATRTERALFQLFHMDAELKLCEQDVADDTEALEELLASVEGKEASLSAEKKAVGDLERESMQHQKKLKRLRVELEHMQPTHVQYETEVSGLTRRIQGDEASLVKARGEVERRATTLAKLESDVAQAKASIAQLDRDIVSAEEASVSASSMAEYKHMKDVAATRTAALQQESVTAARALEVFSRQKEALVAEQQAAISRRDVLTGDVDVYGDRGSDLLRLMEQARNELSDLEAEHARAVEMGGEREQIRARLERTINDTTQALRDAKADLNESSHRRRFEDALEHMARLFPGVKGRLSDLCKPSQDRYREAVAVVFGKLMDAIVVDNQRTGTECINYLKEQRVGMATFIPLADVRPRPIDESLRRIGGTANLVVDVVEHEEFVAPAVHYAAGNAVVCDTLDEARRIRYDGGRRLKVCSLDGTLINKSGFMTGGGSASDDKAGKWDRAEIDALKKKRARAQKELDTIGPPGLDRRAAAERSERIDSLRRKLSILEQDRAEALRSRERASSELATLESDLRKVRLQVDAACRGLDQAQARVSDLSNQMAGLENEVFGDFTSRNGVSSVREFEEQFIRKSEGLREQKLELETRHSRLSSQLKYEQSKGQGSSVSRLEKRIAEQTKRLEKAEENLENLRSKRAEVEDRASKLEEQIERVGSELESKKDALKEARQEFAKNREAVADRRKVVSQKRNRAEVLRSKRAQLLTSCKVERISVPLLGGETLGDDDDDEEEDDVARASASVTDRRRSREGSKDVNEGSDLELAEDTEKGDSSARHSAAAGGDVQIDFSSLGRRLKSQSSAEARAEAVERFDDQIRACEDQLGNLAPNMRASEHMADVSSRLDDLDKEAEQAKERAKTAVEEFENVKDERLDRFNACFSHVANKICEVYKQLTKSQNYPMGGTAYLSLEQQDEPYLGGVKFNAMPPTKRFRDMDQLSGGERTVAALALLFAIHDYKPSPFFILDEVDAALDTGNVSKVSSYIQSRSSDLQTVVITLKDAFFEKADALVGIYRDMAVNASRTLTLDLTSFDMSSDAPASAPSVVKEGIAA